MNCVPQILSQILGIFVKETQGIIWDERTEFSMKSPVHWPLLGSFLHYFHFELLLSCLVFGCQWQWGLRFTYSHCVSEDITIRGYFPVQFPVAQWLVLSAGATWMCSRINTPGSSFHPWADQKDFINSLAFLSSCGWFWEAYLSLVTERLGSAPHTCSWFTSLVVSSFISFLSQVLGSSCKTFPWVCFLRNQTATQDICSSPDSAEGFTTTDSFSSPSTAWTFLKFSFPLVNKKTEERKGYVSNPSLQN